MMGALIDRHRGRKSEVRSLKAPLSEESGLRRIDNDEDVRTSELSMA